MSKITNSRSKTAAASPLLRSIVQRLVDELIPYARNSRTHGEAQIAQIAASIKEFDFTNPVLIDETNTIIAGDARVRAARKLGMTHVPCIVLAGLSPAQKAAYVIADNKLALSASWDNDALLAELQFLAEQDFDLNLTAFSAVEIADLGDLDAAVAAVVADLQKAEAAGDGDKKPETESDKSDNYGGMPEVGDKSDKPFRTITVHFADQGAVDAFAARTGLNITDKTKYVWFPVHVKRVSKGLVYA